MPHFFRNEPSFWRLSPEALGYTSVFAEAVDHRVASFVMGEEDDVEAPLALFMNLPPGVGARPARARLPPLRGGDRGNHDRPRRSGARTRGRLDVAAG